MFWFTPLLGDNDKKALLYICPQAKDILSLTDWLKWLDAKKYDGDSTNMRTLQMLELKMLQVDRRLRAEPKPKRKYVKISDRWTRCKPKNATVQKSISTNVTIPPCYALTTSPSCGLDDYGEPPSFELNDSNEPASPYYTPTLPSYNPMSPPKRKFAMSSPIQKEDSIKRKKLEPACAPGSAASTTPTTLSSQETCFEFFWNEITNKEQEAVDSFLKTTVSQYIERVKRVIEMPIAQQLGLAEYRILNMRKPITKLSLLCDLADALEDKEAKLDKLRSCCEHDTETYRPCPTLAAELANIEDPHVEIDLFEATCSLVHFKCCPKCCRKRKREDEDDVADEDDVDEEDNKLVIMEDGNVSPFTNQTS